jgi:hypothetical protein
MLRVAWGGAALVAALALAGCGGGKDADVSGTVTVNGELVEEGAITFIPADGQGPTTGGAIKGGKYAVKKVPLGLMKVKISKPKFVREKELYPGQKNSPKQAVMAEDLPARYSDDEKTELRYEVHSGSNTKDFPLEK